MSSNNDNSGIALVLGFAGAAIMVLWIVVFAFFAFLAFVFTILSLMAWRKPLHMGTLTITPEEAHAFVKRGMAGAFILPAFFIFVEVFLGVNLNWDYLPYFIVSGYIIGSVGVEMMIQHDLEQRQAAAAAQGMNSQQIAQPVVYKQLPGSAEHRQPFTYASWDDEEKRG